MGIYGNSIHRQQWRLRFLYSQHKTAIVYNIIQILAPTGRIREFLQNREKIKSKWTMMNKLLRPHGNCTTFNKSFVPKQKNKHVCNILIIFKVFFFLTHGIIICSIPALLFVIRNRKKKLPCLLHDLLCRSKPWLPETTKTNQLTNIRNIDDFKVQPFWRPNGSNHIFNEWIQTFLSMLGDWCLPEWRDEEPQGVKRAIRHFWNP